MPKRAILSKESETLIKKIAVEPRLYTAEVESGHTGGFEVVIWLSKEKDRMMNPKRVYSQSGFTEIGLAVNALLEYMEKVANVDESCFQAKHLRALRVRLGKKSISYLIPLHEIMQSVQ